jgi:D-xylulose reductase
MLTTMVALASGCSRVFITDVSEAKCKIAESIAPHAVKGIDITKHDPVQVVKDATNGWAADVMFECSGNHRSAERIAAVCHGRPLCFLLLPFLPCQPAPSLLVEVSLLLAHRRLGLPGCCSLVLSVAASS